MIAVQTLIHRCCFVGYGGSVSIFRNIHSRLGSVDFSARELV